MERIAKNKGTTIEKTAINVVRSVGGNRGIDRGALRLAGMIWWR